MTRKFLNQLTREVLQLVRDKGYAIDSMTVSVLISVDEFNRLQPIPPINKRLRNLFAILFGRAENSSLSLHFSLGSANLERPQVQPELFINTGNGQYGFSLERVTEPTNIVISEGKLFDLLTEIREHIISRDINFEGVMVHLNFDTEGIKPHSPHPEKLEQYYSGQLLVRDGNSEIMANYHTTTKTGDFNNSDEL
jgi:hypothetical protein